VKAFQRVSEFDGKQLKAFLGVPIIHQRKLFGVLAVQQEQARHFEIDEETFLISLAAQISPVLSRNQTSSIIWDKQPLTRNIHGTAASPGIAIGQAQIVFPSENIHAVPDRKANDIDQELQLLANAVDKTHEQLEEMCEQMQGKVSDQEISLFRAYQQILGSKGLAEEVEKVIRQGFWAATALRKVVQTHLNEFKSMDDPYLRERGSDLEDLANRVLTHLLSSKDSKYNIKPGTIIVSGNITAGMIAELPIDNIVGIVSLKGSSTSHAAILVKALGLPAIMGLESCPITRMDNQQLIIDGYNGQLYISPNQEIVGQYKRLLEEEKQLDDELSLDAGLPNMTKDGVLISLMINNSFSMNIKQAESHGVDGIGLYRTEIPFMQLDNFPSEEEQVKIYRQTIQSFADLPITMRTLDIGGDKQLNYFGIDEDNPFLGSRGVRFTLAYPEIFLIQLRAIFRASLNIKGLKLLLPMISTHEELNRCLQFIEQAFCEVEEEFVNEQQKLYKPQIGIIIEVPASIFQLKSFAKKIDFVSVGTNDLVQYTMAVDRCNLRVKKLYNHFQPAVLNVLNLIAKECKQLKLPTQVCGEMAADPLAILLLVGMGYFDLSMNLRSLNRVKRVISRFTLTEMQQLVSDVDGFESAPKVKDYLFKILEERGLAGLVRAGN